MNRWKFLTVLLISVGAFMVPTVMPAFNAHAVQTTVIRYASLAPPGSTFMKILNAWGRSFKQATEGRAEIRYYFGGSQGDERDYVRKIRAGQMDAAGVTTVGLSTIVRPTLVLSSPGLIVEYDQLRAAREALDSRFEKMFQDAGFVLLAWGDGGKNRLFSERKIESPSDLKSMRPWAWKDDPVFSKYLSVIGANPVHVGLNEVYPGLQTQMIDVVSSSALAAVALQWYTRLKFVTKQNINIIVGGSIIGKKAFNKLNSKDQKTLLQTAHRASDLLEKLVQRDDDKSYQSLLKRGLTEVNLEPHMAEWNEVAEKTRNALVGRVYSKSLLKSVEKVVQKKKK